MNDVKIRAELEDFCSAKMTREDLIGYFSGMVRSVLSEDVEIKPSKAAGLMLFISNMVKSELDRSDVLYNKNAYEVEYKTLSKSSGVVDFDSPREIIEYVEQSILSMTDIFLDEQMTNYEFRLDLNDSGKKKHKHVLVKYAVVSCLISLLPILKISNKTLMSRYELTHSMKNYIESNFSKITMSANSNESKFIESVNKFSRELKDRLNKNTNFVL